MDNPSDVVDDDDDVVLLQHEGSETRGYCIYDMKWINPLGIKVTRNTAVYC